MALVLLHSPACLVCDVRSSQQGLIARLERSLQSVGAHGVQQRPAADGQDLIAFFNLPVPVPDSPRQAVAAGREVQELVATEEQISRPRLDPVRLALVALVALAQATGNLIAAERGLPVTVMKMPPR
ncbi:MAG: hypothetical protein NTW51_02690 [Cyanobacteria bacterium]|nr:hypothetical protein [Cyanobacteriota bacterium]